MRDRWKNTVMPLLPGLGLTALIAAVCQGISLGHQILDPLVLCMLTSIILGNLLGTGRAFQPGVAFSRDYLIPLGIILYGLQLDLHPFGHQGAGRVVHVIAMVAVGLAAIFFLCRALGISRRTGMLIAAGSVICGASAIVVLSPIVRAEKEETSVSLLAITVIGLMGVIFYPLLQDFLNLSAETYALLCGSTLFQMGQVRSAASFLGENILTIAVPLKLLRISMLLPVSVVYAFLSGNDQRRLAAAPWFIAGFAITAVSANVLPSLAQTRDAVAPAATFLFSNAIAGIGLSIDLESIFDAGLKPFAAASLGLLVMIALFFLGSAFIH